ncbi:MAG: hypothetical protein D6722_29605, partial [Bacteroidetes bacterium]
EAVAAHERWVAETQDWGLIPEPELKRRLWPPDGEQPVTATVTFMATPLGPDSVQLDLKSATEGASIAWTQARDSTDWQLYTGPLTLARGTPLFAQAIRIGYRHSPMSRWEE